MSELAAIAQHLAQLFETGDVPEELMEGVVLRAPVQDECCIQLRWLQHPPGWVLGVDRSLAQFDAHRQAQWQERLLRTAHASRWEQQLVGVLDAEGRVGLLDMDFPGSAQHAVTHACAQAIEGRLQVLLQQLRRLGVAELPAAVTAAGDVSPVASCGANTWLKA